MLLSHPEVFMKFKRNPVFQDFLTLLFIFFVPCLYCYGGDIKLLQEFRGVLPGSPQKGDLFGNALSVNYKFFFVGSPGASPAGNDAAGALYFYHKTPVCKWEPHQPAFVVPFSADFLTYNKILSRKDWLFVALTGTPSDVSSPKDLSGSILVFKKIECQWTIIQTLTNPKGIVNGQNELFGAHFDSDGKKWLVVGGDFTDTVYFYKLNVESGFWELSQREVPPGIIGEQTIFTGLSERHVLASALPASFPGNSNGKVYAYELNDNEQWEYIQTFGGNSPISLTYNTGDLFGKAISIYHNWAIIGAPTDNEWADLAGAIYFFHFSESKREWIQMQKFFSELPCVFFGWNVSIEKNIAVVGDPGRTILNEEGKQLFQGAAVVFRRHPITWKQGERTWSLVETVLDFYGQAYDFFGGGGIDIHGGLIGIGSNPYNDFYLPDTYPGKRTFPLSETPNKGHAILYRNEH